MMAPTIAATNAISVVKCSHSGSAENTFASARIKKTPMMPLEGHSAGHSRSVANTHQLSPTRIRTGRGRPRG